MYWHNVIMESGVELEWGEKRPETGGTEIITQKSQRQRNENQLKTTDKSGTDIGQDWVASVGIG